MNKINFVFFLLVLSIEAYAQSYICLENRYLFHPLPNPLKQIGMCIYPNLPVGSTSGLENILQEDKL